MRVKASKIFERGVRGSCAIVWSRSANVWSCGSSLTVSSASGSLNSGASDIKLEIGRARMILTVTSQPRHGGRIVKVDLVNGNGNSLNFGKQSSLTSYRLYCIRNYPQGNAWSDGSSYSDAQNRRLLCRWCRYRPRLGVDNCRRLVASFFNASTRQKVPVDRGSVSNCLGFRQLRDRNSEARTTRPAYRSKTPIEPNRCYAGANVTTHVQLRIQPRMCD